MKTFLSILSLFFICGASSAQIDSISIQKLLDEAFELETTNPPQAIKIYEQVLQESKQINYHLGAFRALLYTGIVESNLGHYDRALELYQSAIPFSRKAHYEVGEASAKINIGNVFQFKGNLRMAIDPYLEGAKIYENNRDSAHLVMAYANLAGLYKSLDNIPLTLKTYQKALYYCPATDSFNQCDIYNNIGIVLLQDNKLDSAYFYITKAQQMNAELGNQRQDFFIHRNLGEYYSYRQKYIPAIRHFTQALSLSKKINDAFYTNEIHFLIGQAYFEIGNMDLALKHTRLAIQWAERHQSNEILYKAHHNLAKTYHHLGNPKDFATLALSHQIKDSIITEKYLLEIAALETLYESKKKDNDLMIKDLQIDQNKTALIKSKAQTLTLGIIGLILFFASIIGWLYFRQRQYNKNQQISSLKERQKIIELEAIINGEEKERHRLAQDLHDGINGDLSVIKYKLTSVNIQSLNPKETKLFQESIQLLDNAVEQVRRISHNLAPPALHNFNLIEAIEQYCARINSSTPLNISFQVFGDIIHLHKDQETAIYRIIQELINNIVKHAQATEAIVQLNIFDNNMTITVEDNGKGFDVKKVNLGMGLHNIKSRIAFLQAELEVHSNSAGSTFSIHVPLTPKNTS